MSVRHALLALLSEHPQHGYQLKAGFEARTGGTWPLNIGQVYSTLQRLEGNGLVRLVTPATDGVLVYDVTDAGRKEVGAWFRDPVQRVAPARDELAIKLALAVSVQGVDVAELVQAQRRATVQWLQELTRLKADPHRSEDLAWSLLVERMLFEAEAETRWLDHVEGAVVRGRDAHDRAAEATPSADSATSPAADFSASPSGPMRSDATSGRGVTR